MALILLSALWLLQTPKSQARVNAAFAHAVVVALALAASPMTIAASESIRGTAQGILVQDVMSQKYIGTISPIGVFESAGDTTIAVPVCSSDQVLAPAELDLRSNPIPDLRGCRLMIRKGDRSPYFASGEGYSAWAPAFSPDGQQLAYLADPDNRTSLFVMDVRSGKTRSLGSANSIQVPLWISRREVVFVATNDEVPDRTLSKKAATASETILRFSTIRDRRAAPTQTSAAGDMHELFGDLVAVNSRDGARRTLSTRKRFNTGELRSTAAVLDPTGQFLAYQDIRRFGGPSGFQSYVDVYVQSLAGGTAARMIATDVPIDGRGNMSWSPDGARLVWISSGPDADGALNLFDKGAAETKRVRLPRSYDVNLPPYAIAGSSSWPLIWNGPNRLVVPVATEATKDFYTKIPNAAVIVNLETGAVVGHYTFGAARIHKLLGVSSTGTPGKESPLIALVQEQNGAMSVEVSNGDSHRTVARETSGTYLYDVPNLPRLSDDKNFLYVIRQSFSERPSVVRISLSNGATQPVFLLPGSYSTARVGSSRILEYTAKDGSARKAAAFLPFGWSREKKVPTIVYVYPFGGMADMVRGFAGDQAGIGSAANNFHLFTSRGFAVIVPDIVTTQGRAAQQITAEVTAAVDEAEKEGIADRDRLGVIGVSYGGYSVYCLMTYSSLFKAGVVESGFSNWISAYLYMDDKEYVHGATQAESTSRGPGGTLWTNQRGYIENSPLFRFDEVKGAILIIHGSDDFLNQAEARYSFAALKRLGKTSELIIYPGEGHSPSNWSRSHLEDRTQRVIEWFETYLCSAAGGGRRCRSEPVQ